MSTSTEVIMVAEAARRLGLGERTVRRRVLDGSIPGRKIGRRFVIPRWAIEQLLAPPGDTATAEPRRVA